MSFARKLIWRLLALGLLALAGFYAYVNLVDPHVEAQHVDPLKVRMTDRPNQHLILPEGMGAGPSDRASAIYDVGAAELAATLDGVALAESRTRRVAGDPAELWTTYEQRPRFFGFPDYISVRIVPLDAEHSAVAIYSRSIYGYSDMNVNAARVQRWLEAVARELR